jgi:hypothetical protein
MIGPISGVHAKKQDSNSPEQEIVLLELEPRPRWPRYTPFLVLAGILGAVVCAYYYLRPVSIDEITGSDIYQIHCDKQVSTWGTVTVAYYEEPGFDEIDGGRHGYWLKDINELGIESEIAVFYDSEKSAAPALGQSLKISGILECKGGHSPERIAIYERYRRVQ